MSGTRVRRGADPALVRHHRFRTASLLVGDIGLPSNLPVQLPSRVWRLDPVGHYDLAGSPPKPQPLASGSLTLQNVVAVAVRPARAAAPETLYVLDRPGALFAIPAPFPGTPATKVTSLAQPGKSFWPVAMAVDPASGNLLVLDRGDVPDNPSATSLVTVQPAPLTVTRTSLSSVTEPLSLAVNPDGTLLVGDGGDQDPASARRVPGKPGPDRPDPGDLDGDAAAACGQSAGRADRDRAHAGRAAVRARRRA